MPVCESGTASPSKLEEIIIELMLFTMPRFSILKTRTRSSVRNLGVEKVSIAKVEQDSSVVDVFQYPEDSLPSRDIKPVNIVNEFSENSKLTHKIEETDIVTYFTKFVKLANLFYQANNAKKSTIKSKRTEISSWCCYSERFEDKVMELRSDKKLTDQTTYNEMKPFLTGVSDGYLHYMTCKARKINKLFGYEYDPVSLEKNNDQVNSKTVNMLTIRVMYPKRMHQQKKERMKCTLINRNRIEVARLKAIKAINDVEDIKIFDDDFFSDELIDSNHPINARTERVPEGPRISVQKKNSNTLDDLKEILRRNKVNGEDITSIKQFTPVMMIRHSNTVWRALS
ncbi:hypothetical protein GLOIN_2v1772112 [Rhizophagus irregularis DAOM 181602=DAOM 197198]|nr:hypothetical protein GLOIN_2v1772112 [Rhizophagus irregularis DAOM 181602=DAOM 197198]